ncbi:MAG TPA: carboxypeptidase-like regulatory domain-containing protein [Planctomycetota bacterium]|jgi:hypothetical protein|nr:carboxypeptidase-like regulatory domain-containing protein [Planctomycetota bacterium]
MSAPKRAALLVLGAGLLFGLAAWALLTPTRRDRGGTTPTAAAPSELATTASEEAASAPADRVAIEAPAPPPVAAPSKERPASFLRCLGRVRGRVLDWDGTPVSDLAVDGYVFDLVALLPAASALFGEETYRPRILDASARTNGEGRFVLEGLDPKMPHALLLGLGTARATARFLDHAPGPGETVDLGDLVLPPYATLVGKVVDEEGRPIPGARVRATDLPAIVVAAGAGEVRGGSAVYANKTVFELPRWADDLIDRFPVPTTTSGLDGSFRLEGAPVAANVTIVADHPEFVALTHGPVSTAEGGERDLGSLELEAGETLAGMVVDGNDRPVAGAEVLAGTKIPLGEIAVLRPAGRSDAGGRFRVPAMASAPAYVACRRGAPDPWTVVGPVSPGLDPAQVRLAAVREVEILVRGAAGPVKGEGVEILYRRDEGWNEVAVLAPPLRAKARRGGEEGLYVVERVPDGKYEFLVRAPGYAVGTTKVEVREGSGRAEVALEPAVPLLVRVLAEGSGEAIEYAYVGGRPGEVGEVRPPVVSGRTDARGEARLAGLKAGKIVVVVVHPGYAVVQEEVTLPAESVTVRLHGGGTVEGKVHSGGAPPAQSVMVLAGPDGGTLRMPRFTATDAEGSFRISNVDPGKYKFVALPRLADKTFLGLFEMAEADPEMAEAEATVEEGKTTRVEIDLRGQAGENVGTIRGRVWVNGHPAEGASVRAWSRRSRAAKADASGAYELAGVASGDVHLNVSLPRDDGIPGGQPLLARRVRLQAGAVEEVNFEVEAGALAGRVVSGKTGNPVPYAQLSARRLQAQGEEEEGWHRPFGLADAEGRFRFPKVRTGSYDVQGRADGFARGTVLATVGAGSETGEVLVVLPVATLVKGRVVFDSPPEEAQWVGLSFQKGSGERRDGVGWARLSLPEGTFETDDLAPGTYTAQVTGPNLRYRPIEVVIPEGGATSLVVQAVRETEPRPPAGPTPR